jgi:hypothetical protein
MNGKREMTSVVVLREPIKMWPHLALAEFPTIDTSKTMLYVDGLSTNSQQLTIYLNS